MDYDTRNTLLGRIVARYYDFMDRATLGSQPPAERIALLDQADGELRNLIGYANGLRDDANARRARLAGEASTGKTTSA